MDPPNDFDCESASVDCAPAIPVHLRAIAAGGELRMMRIRPLGFTRTCRPGGRAAAIRNSDFCCCERSGAMGVRCGVVLVEVERTYAGFRVLESEAVPTVPPMRIEMLMGCLPGGVARYPERTLPFVSPFVRYDVLVRTRTMRGEGFSLPPKACELGAPIVMEAWIGCSVLRANERNTCTAVQAVVLTLAARFKRLELVAGESAGAQWLAQRLLRFAHAPSRSEYCANVGERIASGFAADKDSAYMQRMGTIRPSGHSHVIRCAFETLLADNGWGCVFSLGGGRGVPMHMPGMWELGPLLLALSQLRESASRGSDRMKQLWFGLFEPGASLRRRMWTFLVIFSVLPMVLMARNAACLYYQWSRRVFGSDFDATHTAHILRRVMQQRCAQPYGVSHGDFVEWVVVVGMMMHISEVAWRDALLNIVGTFCCESNFDCTPECMFPERAVTMCTMHRAVGGTFAHCMCDPVQSGAPPRLALSFGGAPEPCDNTCASACTASNATSWNTLAPDRALVDLLCTRLAAAKSVRALAVSDTGRQMYDTVRALRYTSEALYVAPNVAMAAQASAILAPAKVLDVDAAETHMRQSTTSVSVVLLWAHLADLVCLVNLLCTEPLQSTKRKRTHPDAATTTFHSVCLVGCVGVDAHYGRDHVVVFDELVHQYGVDHGCEVADAHTGASIDATTHRLYRVLGDRSDRRFVQSTQVRAAYAQLCTRAPKYVPGSGSVALFLSRVPPRGGERPVTATEVRARVFHQLGKSRESTTKVRVWLRCVGAMLVLKQSSAAVPKDAALICWCGTAYERRLACGYYRCTIPRVEVRPAWLDACIWNFVPYAPFRSPVCSGLSESTVERCSAPAMLVRMQRLDPVIMCAPGDLAAVTTLDQIPSITQYSGPKLDTIVLVVLPRTPLQSVLAAHLCATHAVHIVDVRPDDIVPSVSYATPWGGADGHWLPSQLARCATNESSKVPRLEGDE